MCKRKVSREVEVVGALMTPMCPSDMQTFEELRCNFLSPTLRSLLLHLLTTTAHFEVSPRANQRRTFCSYRTN
jgi:hypothetical protein